MRRLAAAKRSSSCARTSAVFAPTPNSCERKGANFGANWLHHSPHLTQKYSNKIRAGNPLT